MVQHTPVPTELSEDRVSAAEGGSAIVEPRSTEEQTEPEQIIAVVTDLARQPHGERIVALDNGQVWAEEFASRGLRVEIGDKVTIKKRLFGGYRMLTEHGKAVAVERLR